MAAQANGEIQVVVRPELGKPCHWPHQSDLSYRNRPGYPGK